MTYFDLVDGLRKMGFPDSQIFTRLPFMDTSIPLGEWSYYEWMEFDPITKETSKLAWFHDVFPTFASTNRSLLADIEAKKNGADIYTTPTIPYDSRTRTIALGDMEERRKE